MFAGREGEEVAAANVTLVDDPTLADAFGAATHDGEGVPATASRRSIGGRLQGFLHNVYTARRSSTHTTGSAMRGFKSTPRGRRGRCTCSRERSRPRRSSVSPEALYVQSVSGLHSGTNPVSGDFSVGAEGLMVRGGAFAEPVREITIASTLQRMLLDVAEVKPTTSWLPGGGAGLALLVSDMQMSGECALTNAQAARPGTPSVGRIRSAFRGCCRARHGGEGSSPVDGFHAGRASRGTSSAPVVVTNTLSLAAAEPFAEWAHVDALGSGLRIRTSTPVDHHLKRARRQGTWPIFVASLRCW